MSPRSEDGFLLTGLGLVTPAGPNAPATCCALRAGIPCFDALPDFWVGDPNGEPVMVQGAAIPDCLEVEAGYSRLTSHTRRALREALADAGLGHERLENSRLYLGHEPDLDPHFLVQAVRGILPEAPEPALYPDGRCAALTALAGAVADLSAGRVEVAVVGAAASWVELSRLIMLSHQGTLQTPAVPDGVLPGEAAGFLVLESAARAIRRRAHAYAQIMGVGTADETTGVSDEPCQGVGLTEAVRQAMSAAEPEGGRVNLPLVVCDLNGDHYRAMEWGLASVRSFCLLGGDTVSWEPACLIGDCGAGMGLVNLAWAATALDQGYAESPEVIVWGGAEGTARAAALIMPAPGRT